jgi:hypothetical protein
MGFPKRRSGSNEGEEEKKMEEWTKEEGRGDVTGRSSEKADIMRKGADDRTWLRWFT